MLLNTISRAKQNLSHLVSVEKAAFPLHMWMISLFNHRLGNDTHCSHPCIQMSSTKILMMLPKYFLHSFMHRSCLCCRNAFCNTWLLSQWLHPHVRTLQLLPLTDLTWLCHRTYNWSPQVHRVDIWTRPQRLQEWPWTPAEWRPDDNITLYTQWAMLMST